MHVSVPHIRALDGLRGLAVLLILLFHAGHLEGGWLGVDLFFVLSGFLVTSLLLVEWKGTASISLVSFWKRRGRRLLPALFVFLLGVCLYAVTVATPEELARIRAEGAATLLYVANWHAIFSGHDYWEIFRAPSPLDHTWSLSIEEQFYLVWPTLVLLLMRATRGSHRVLLVVATLLAWLSACWMMFLFEPGVGTARVYFGSDTRAAATLLGAAVAAGLKHRVEVWPGTTSSRTADGLAVLGLGVLLVASWGLDGSEPTVYRGGLFAVDVACCLVVIGLVLAPNGFVTRGLSSTLLRKLGFVSYGAYLWHWPVFIFLTPERVNLDGWLLTGVRIATTLVIATISYRVLEHPIRRGKVPDRILWRTTGVATLALVLLGWGATIDGPRSIPAESPSLASIAPDGRNLDVVVIGDSIPYILGAQFLEEAARRGIRAKVMGVEACGALRASKLRYLSGHTFNLEVCTAYRKGWIATVAAQQPAAVILLEGWTGEGSKRIDGVWTHPCESTFDEAYARDLEDLFEQFSAAGSVAAVVTVPPPSVQDLPSRFSKLWGGTSSQQLDALFRERVSCQNEVRKNAAADRGAVVIDLEDQVCPNGKCRRYLEGEILRKDGIHFEGAGASWASRQILERLEAAL
ncbi:MAG: acyltransferase family protein [Myxococcota bacterium]|nr:acyltransferase family protein [Myxococcota bacterium]